MHITDVILYIRVASCDNVAMKNGDNKKTAERPDVMSYENYRTYLSDWCAWMKETRSGFSYRAFSGWAGFKSPNHLQLVIQGKRNLTRKTVPIFSDVLKLKRREKRFFEQLVNLNQATNPKEKADCLLEITRLFGKHSKNLFHDKIEYLTKWFYVVLRELVTMKGFRNSRHEIARRIGHGISPRQVDEALGKLLKLGFLKEDSKGNLKQTDAVLTTGPESSEAASYIYHEQMIKLALEALKTQCSSERNVSAVTFACRKEDIPEISQILSDCRSQLLSFLDSRGTIKDEDVYQLNLQLFRITEKGKST
jgi:uncharacterized protein (TIGR02147 family)